MNASYSIEELLAMADEKMAPISEASKINRKIYLELSDQIKELESKRKAVAAEMRAEAEGKGVLTLVDHDVSLFEIVQCTRTSVDTSEMAKIYPEIVEQFTVSKPYTRIDVKK